jgi:hypothetical protein
MSNFKQYNYKETFPHNLSTAILNLKDKNIIYSTQYLYNEDVQCDGDGYNSWWNITLFSVEKTEDDYIFHFNYSNEIHGYSEPYYKHVSKFTLYSKKLSDLKNDIYNIFNKVHDNNVGQLIEMWNEEYCFAFKTDDANLLTELKNLSDKMVEIEELYEKQCELDRVEYDKQREEYEKSEEYKQYLQDEKDRREKEEEEYQKREEDRLKLWIEKYGEVEGRQYHARL